MNSTKPNRLLRGFREILSFFVILGITGLMLFSTVAWIELFRFLGRITSGPMLMFFLLFNGITGVWLGRIVERRCFLRKPRVLHWQQRWLAWVLVVVIAVLAIVFHAKIFSPIGDFLMVAKSPQPADIIWILGIADERYAYGADLYQRGYGKKLIMSLEERDVSLLFETNTIKTNVDAIQNYVMRKGIPESAVLMIAAKNTYEEALRAKEYIQENGIQSAMIVSSPEHMRRVKMIFDHVIGNNAQLTMTAVPLNQSRFKRSWWTDQYSLGRVIYEYLSLGYYFFRYILL